MSTFAYARVSTTDQNTDRQLLTLDNIHADYVYIDKASGRDFNRPAYTEMVSHLSPGDVVYVTSIGKRSVFHG